MVVVNFGLHLSVSLRPVLILIVAHDLVHEDVVVRSTAPHGTPRHCAAKVWVAVLFQWAARSRTWSVCCCRAFRKVWGAFGCAGLYSNEIFAGVARGLVWGLCGLTTAELQSCRLELA